MAVPSLTLEQIAQVSGLVAEWAVLDFFHDCVHKLEENRGEIRTERRKIGLLNTSHTAA
jgi:hypothetical protein